MKRIKRDGVGAQLPLMVVCRSFDGVAGGVERMATELMNAMVVRGREVHLLTWDTGTPEPFYDIASEIKWHRLNLGAPDHQAGQVLRLRRARAIRQICRSVRPGIAVCFQHANFLFARLAALGLPISFIAAERNAPTRFDHSSEGSHKELILQSMRLASRVAVQFDSYIDLYPDYLRRKLVAIPNPVLAASDRAAPSLARDGKAKVLLSVGRLSFQKNFAALIAAFARIAGGQPDWRIDLVGDGDQEARLRALVMKLGLEDRVRFLGKRSDVASLYTQADLFCLPSRWEGFPNALAEALASGLPSVGYADCAGVNGLIEDGVNGLLAGGNGDPQTLADALSELMNEPGTRATMGAAACRIVDRYAPAHVFDLWEALFDELAAEARGAGSSHRPSPAPLLAKKNKSA